MIRGDRPTRVAKRAKGLARLLRRNELRRCACGHGIGTHYRRAFGCRQCRCLAFEPEQQGAVSS